MNKILLYFHRMAHIFSRRLDNDANKKEDVVSIGWLLLWCPCLMRRGQHKEAEVGLLLDDDDHDEEDDFARFPRDYRF